SANRAARQQHRLGEHGLAAALVTDQRYVADMISIVHIHRTTSEPSKDDAGAPRWARRSLSLRRGRRPRRVRCAYGPVRPGTGREMWPALLRNQKNPC